MEKKPLITIAIPTYNREDYLEECLDNILQQLTPDIENDIIIEIFDNASTDNTHAILEKYSSHKNIFSYFNKENLGMDKNFQRCLYDSNGKFIFLMSDDDILLPGALRIVYDFVFKNQSLSLIHLNSKSFTKVYNEKNLTPPRISSNKNIITTSKKQFIEELDIWITFISSLIINREKLISKEESEKYFGTYFIQSHIALLSTKGDSKIGIVAFPCIAARGGNSGGYKFYHVWCYNLKKLFLNTGVEAGYDQRTMRKVFIQSMCATVNKNILSLKTEENSFELDSFFILFKNTYMYPKVWIYVYPIALLPSSILKILRKVKKILKK